MASRATPVAAPAAPSKTVAAWLALLAGLFGAHRFYLHGWRDWIGWLHPLPSLLGLAGIVRMRNLGQDDLASWALIPLFGVMMVVAMLSTIVIGLTPDERWAQRFGTAAPVATRWGPVLAVVIALLLGGGAAMGTLAFGGQKFFEYQRLRDEAAGATPGAWLHWPDDCHSPSDRGPAQRCGRHGLA